jgi:NAD+ synthase
MTGTDALSIAVVQCNPVVGDVAGNASRMAACYAEASAAGAQLVVFPEMALVGYPPEDLILIPDFRHKAIATAKALAEKTADGPAMLFGCVWEDQGKIQNAALFCEAGKVRTVYAKAMLPNHGIFDEKRLFEAGSGAGLVEWNGIRLGLLICEDVWFAAMAESIKKNKAELTIVINASPFEAGKCDKRHNVVARAAKQSGSAMLYVNMVGGQDDIVFDGGSFAVSAQGDVDTQLTSFDAAVHMTQWKRTAKGWQAEAATDMPVMPLEETLWQAMQLGLRDYVRKNGFETVVLGLSGGIDSALTAALAVDALGPDYVKGILLPSPYTSHESVEDAESLARLLDIETFNVPITAEMEIFEQVLNPVFMDAGWMETPAIGGNLQARLRGVTLMAISNKFGWMLLSTGNKSEVAVGYSTLYGDSCGGYNVLKDLYKTQVYALAHWRNGRGGQVIPLRSITKAPTAELAPGAKKMKTSCRLMPCLTRFWHCI